MIAWGNVERRKERGKGRNNYEGGRGAKVRGGEDEDEEQRYI